VPHPKKDVDARDKPGHDEVRPARPREITATPWRKLPNQP
jgi:hypothetical protein